MNFLAIEALPSEQASLWLADNVPREPSLLPHVVNAFVVNVEAIVSHELLGDVFKVGVARVWFGIGQAVEQSAVDIPID